MLLATLALAAAALAGEVEDARAAFEAAWRGTDYQAKVAAIERLVATGDVPALKLVLDRALTTDDQFVFERATEILKEKTTPEGRAWLADQAAKHRSRDVRVVLVRMCGGLEAPGALGAIVAALGDREWTIRVAAIRAARERRAKALVAPLIEVVRTEDGRVREDAIDALRDLTGADYGRDAKRWAAWWAEVEKDFRLKPPLVRGDEDASEVASDVETVSREGLYQVRSKRTLFIVDISASMEARTPGGSRLDVTKRELERAIRGLDDDMLFNVLFFGDRARLWRARMVKAGGANKGSALGLVKRQKAEGMTGTYEALKLAFSLEDVDSIYFLSDGFPTVGPVTSEELLKAEVRKWNRSKGIAVHTIAFVAGELKGEREDKRRAKDFMRELAQENGGTFKVVE